MDTWYAYINNGNLLKTNGPYLYSYIEIQFLVNEIFSYMRTMKKKFLSLIAKQLFNYRLNFTIY